VQRKIQLACKRMMRRIAEPVAPAKLAAAAEIPGIVRPTVPRIAMHQRRVAPPPLHTLCAWKKSDGHSVWDARAMFVGRRSASIIRTRRKTDATGLFAARNIVADVRAHKNISPRRQRAAIDERSTTKVGAVKFHQQHADAGHARQDGGLR